MSDRAPHPPGMHLGTRVHPGLHPGAPQAEKMQLFSCFSLLSGLLQPGIIPGADFVQETQFPPYFEKLVRTWIKLWGNYMDCLGQADYMDMDYMDIMDSSEIISFLHPVLQKYLYSHTSLKGELVQLCLCLQRGFSSSWDPMMDLLEKPQSRGSCRDLGKISGRLCPKGCLPISQPFGS